MKEQGPESRNLGTESDLETVRKERNRLGKGGGHKVRGCLLSYSTPAFFFFFAGIPLLAHFYLRFRRVIITLNWNWEEKRQNSGVSLLKSEYQVLIQRHRYLKYQEGLSLGTKYVLINKWFSY